MNVSESENNDNGSSTKMQTKETQPPEGKRNNKGRENIRLINLHVLTQNLKFFTRLSILH